MRVAQIVSTSDGAHWFTAICAGLRERGHEVLAVVGDGQGQLAERLERGGFEHRVLRLEAARRSGAASEARRVGSTAAQLAKLLRRERVDVSHAHLFPAMLVARLGASAARVPIRISMAASPFHLESPLQRRIDRATARLDHRIVSGCEYTNRIYASMGVPAARRRTIYYGADADAFQPSRAVPERARAELGIPPGAPLIGNVAYFYPPLVGPLAPKHLRGRAIKGHEDLIAAAALVLAERPDARFVFVGDGWGPEGKQYRRQLEERTRELGLGDQVAFLGHRGDVADLLGGLDVSVQCSLSESLGGTIESLLMERPTIATRVGGMPEAVIHEQTGLTVPPRDPRALADAVLRLLRHPDEAKAFGQRGRALMLERFTLERTFADIDALYAEVAAERRSPVAHTPRRLRETPTR